jgi:hypothetical protein
MVSAAVALLAKVNGRATTASIDNNCKLLLKNERYLDFITSSSIFDGFTNF